MLVLKPGADTLNIYSEYRMCRIFIIIIGVFWTQDAVILFAQIVDSGSEFFSEVELDLLILPECIKSVFINSHTGIWYSVIFTQW